ncbi:tol-pal system YbgF family protein [Streptomyces sp. NPDC021093]|uniref:tol-pal system YbgF family protein n=1 Tax=Streptomyces sp. NPDC021093 TaxID=3365112 RepID=UPI00379201B2
MSRTPNTRLRSLLEATGWSSAQLARMVVAIAAEHSEHLTCDRSTVSRWLAGHQPRPPVPTFLLEALARGLDGIVTAQQAGLSRAPELVHTNSLGDDPVLRLAQLTSVELDGTRRKLIGAAAFSLAALAVPALAAPSSRPRPLRIQEQGVEAQVAQMRAMATMFANAAETHGGGSIRAPLAAYLAHDVSRWLRTPMSDENYRQLLSAAAQLALLLGTMCVDDGDHALAQQHFRTAADLAVEAVDHGMLAVSFRAMATHAYEMGHHGSVVLHLTERAVEAARRAPRVTQVYAQAHLSVLLAHHDRKAALAELARTEKLYDQADSTPGAFTAYPPGGLQYQRAQVFSALGEASQAAAALKTSLRLRTPAEHRASALTHARLAEILLGVGHLDAALAHWGDFLSAYPALRSARIAQRLAVMRQKLQPYGRHRPVATLLNRARELM